MTSEADCMIHPLIKDQVFSIFNPADASEVGKIKNWNHQEIETAIFDAHTALQTWSASTAKHRSKLLQRWRQEILNRKQELAILITRESGKPLKEAEAEIDSAAAYIEWFSEEAKRASGEVIPEMESNKQILTLKQPVGVVAAITPWNFPVSMIVRKVAPALAAGCSVIVKPSEETPLSAIEICESAHASGIPKNVLQIVTCQNPETAGRLLSTHPSIRKVSFTGSSAVGKKLLSQAAGTVKKVSMELGGNAPFIVFEDADIEAAVDGAIVSKFRNTGQTCVCANRFFIHHEVYDQFVSQFESRVKKLKIGNGLDPSMVDLGPVINQASIQRLINGIALSLERGSKLRLGGKPIPADGCFFEPTILEGTIQNLTVADDEIFGPIAPMIKFFDEEEVLNAANDTSHGLAAYFYTTNLSRAFRVLKRLEYGMVGVNEGVISTEVAPFGGIKESGLGREGGRSGIEEYLEEKYCLIGG